MSATCACFESFNRPFIAAFRATNGKLNSPAGQQHDTESELTSTTLKRVTLEICWLSARVLYAMNCFSLHTSSTWPDTLMLSCAEGAMVPRNAAYLPVK